MQLCACVFTFKMSADDARVRVRTRTLLTGYEIRELGRERGGEKETSFTRGAKR